MYIYETAIPAFVVTLSSAFVLKTIYKVYKIHHYNDILLLLQAFSMLTFHSLTHLIFSILVGEQYRLVRQIMGRIALGGILLTPLLILIAQLRISGKKYKTRYFLLFLSIPIMIGYAIRSYSVAYNSHGYEAQFQPSFIIYVMVFFVIWTLGEISINLRSHNSHLAFEHVVSLTDFQIAALSSGILTAVIYGIERVFISGTSRYYLFLLAVALFFVAKIIEADITLIVPQDFGITKVLISEKSSGCEIFHWTTNNLARKPEDKLFTAGMSALLTLIWGVTGTPKKIDNLVLEDSHIIVAESERYTGYLLADRISNLLKNEFAKVLVELDILQYYSNMVTESDNQMIKQMFQKRLSLSSFR